MSNDPEVHSEWDCNLGESVFIIIIQENVQTYYPSEPFRITRFQMRHPVNWSICISIFIIFVLYCTNFMFFLIKNWDWHYFQSLTDLQYRFSCCTVHTTLQGSSWQSPYFFILLYSQLRYFCNAFVFFNFLCTGNSVLHKQHALLHYNVWIPCKQRIITWK